MKWNKVARDLGKMLERGVVKNNYSLKEHNTYRLECKARVAILVNSLETFFKTMKYCEENNVPRLVMGRGSNILFVTPTITAVVIIFGNNFSNIYNIDNFVIAEAGATLAEVSRYAKELGLSGMEESVGIPGTIGGAVCMNASAFGYETAKVVSNVLVYSNGRVTERSVEELGFGYRTSNIQGSDDIVLRVELQLLPADKADIERCIKDAIARRYVKKQSAFPNAGSVFKNGNNYYAGELIDKCGLKNYNIGSAFVSANHANFIENRGGATGEDIYNLIKHIYCEVKNRFGIEMELEQKIIGDN